MINFTLIMNEIVIQFTINQLINSVKNCIKKLNMFFELYILCLMDLYKLKGPREICPDDNRCICATWDPDLYDCYDRDNLEDCRVSFTFSNRLLIPCEFLMKVYYEIKITHNLCNITILKFYIYCFFHFL